MKLPIDEEMWNGFDLFFYLDRIYRIIKIFLPAARGPLAEGLIIPMILSNSHYLRQESIPLSNSGLYRLS
jgi:hypothetical protein